MTVYTVKPVVLGRADETIQDMQNEGWTLVELMSGAVIAEGGFLQSANIILVFKRGK